MRSGPAEQRRALRVCQPGFYHRMEVHTREMHYKIDLKMIYIYIYINGEQKMF